MALSKDWRLKTNSLFFLVFSREKNPHFDNMGKNPMEVLKIPTGFFKIPMGFFSYLKPKTKYVLEQRI